MAEKEYEISIEHLNSSVAKCINEQMKILAAKLLEAAERNEKELKEKEKKETIKSSLNVKSSIE